MLVDQTWLRQRTWIWNPLMPASALAPTSHSVDPASIRLFAVWIVNPEVVPEIQRAGNVPAAANAFAAVMFV
jgi:hypothetical protein